MSESNPALRRPQPAEPAASGLRQPPGEFRPSGATEPESERHYRTLIEASHDAIMTLAPPSWKFSAGNRAALALFRINRETAFPATEPWALSPEFQPDGRQSEEKARAMLEQAMREGSLTFEWRHRRVDGEEFPASVSLTRIEFGGQPTLTATVRDITNLKRAEEALGRRDAILEAISSVAALLLSGGDWRACVQQVLGELARATDVSRGYIFEYHHGEDDELLASQRFEWTGPGVEPQLENPQLQNFPLRAAGFGRWIEVLNKVGVVAGNIRDFPAEEQAVLTPQGIRSLVVVAIMVKGRPWGFLGFDECRADRLWSEAEIGALRIAAHTLGAAIEHERRESDLHASQGRLRAIMAATPCCIKLVATDGRLLEINQYGMDMLDAGGADAVVGSCVFPLIAPEHREAFIAFHQRVCAGQSDTLEFELIGLRGRRRWVLSHAAPLLEPQSGETLHLAVTRDITQRKKGEEARAAMEAQLRHVQKLDAVGQLAGGVAHDFNNILTALMMNLNLVALDGQLPPSVRTGLQEMDLLTQRAAALTRQLLLFARRGVIQRQVLDLNSLVQDLLKMLGRLIGEHVRLSFPGGEQALWVNADPGMMEQVATNLVVNARDAMPQGGLVELSVAAVEIDAAHAAAHPEARIGSFVCLAIQDHGCGMEASILRHIFEPFFTTKPIGKGTGLGLSTALGIVQQHEGWIEVETTLGRGSTFRVYLAAVAPPAPKRRAEVMAAELPSGKETILLVEDEAAVRQVTALVLSRQGFQVIQANHGREALAKLEKDGLRVDLLLTDVVMPEGLSGFDLAEQLRHRRPQLPIVFMTGYAAEMMRPNFELPAKAKFLQKPISQPELLRALRELLDAPA